MSSWTWRVQKGGKWTNAAVKFDITWYQLGRGINKAANASIILSSSIDIVVQSCHLGYVVSSDGKFASNIQGFFVILTALTMVIKIPAAHSLILDVFSQKRGATIFLNEISNLEISEAVFVENDDVQSFGQHFFRKKFKGSYSVLKNS